MLPRFKVPRIKDPKHIAYVKTLPCIIIECGVYPCDPHHLLRAGEHGMAYTAGDDKAIPLCRKHHSELHHVGGEEIFFAFYNMSLENMIKYAHDLYWNRKKSVL